MHECVICTVYVYMSIYIGVNIRYKRNDIIFFFLSLYFAMNQPDQLAD